MKIFNRIFIYILVGACLPGYSQNLVPNPSFEDYEECPETISAIAPPTTTVSVLDWYRPSEATSDYFNVCDDPFPWYSSVSVPDNFAGHQFARTGVAYAGIAAVLLGDARLYREYVEARLLAPMIAGHEYYASYWVAATELRTGAAVDQMGAFFSEEEVYIFSEAMLEETPQMQSPEGVIYKDSLGWEQVSGTFRATGGEHWITIGNFVPEDSLHIDTLGIPVQSYYYIDDVCVLDMDSAAPENIIIHDTINCEDAETILRGRSGMGNFRWDDGSTLWERSVFVSGTYWVRSVDTANCRMLVDTFHVIVGGIPIEPFSLGEDTVLCVAPELLLSPDMLPSTGTFTWSDGTHGTSLLADTSGIYWLEVRNGCHVHADTIHIEVAPPSLQLLNKDTTVCQGVAVMVTAIGPSNYSYQWIPEDGVSDPHSLSPVITVGETGEYLLRGSYEGCPDTFVSLSFQVEPNPVITLPVDTSVCPGTMVFLEAGIEPPYEAYTYSWHPASGLVDTDLISNYFYADTSVTYFLEVRTPAGCQAVDSVTVTVFPPMNLSVIADTGICPGDSAILRVNGGTSYVWFPSSGINDSTAAHPVASPQTSTNYTVYVTDIYGCVDTQDIHLEVYPNAVISLPDSVHLYPGEDYAIAPESNCLYYEWFPPSGLSGVHISNPVARPEVRTRYFVTCSTEHGCVTSDSIDILVQGTIIDMPNAFAPGNGNNGLFKPVKRGIVRLNYFQIFNRWGNRVYDSKDIDEGWDGTFNGTPQPMGTYIYIIDAVTVEGKPFVKQGNVLLVR